MGVAIISGFLLYGLAAGYVSLLLQRQTGGAVRFPLNDLAKRLGDAISRYVTDHVKDAHTIRGHSRLLRMLHAPHVYIPVSLIFWGLIGLFVWSAISLMHHLRVPYFLSLVSPIVGNG